MHGAKLVGLTLCYLANLQCSCGLKEGILTRLHDRRKWILLVAALRELDFMSHRVAERGYFSLIILSDAISRDYKSRKYLVTVPGAAVVSVGATVSASAVGSRKREIVHLEGDVEAKCSTIPFSLPVEYRGSPLDTGRNTGRSGISQNE